VVESLAVSTPDGVMNVRLVLPEGAGPWPVVVFLNDAAGDRPAMTIMVQRLAGAGYAVVQPEFYWRQGSYAAFDGQTAFVDPAERVRVYAMMAQVRPADVVADVRAALSLLGSDPRLVTDRVGAVGYCMGGRLAFVVATEVPAVAAVAAIHAGGLVNETPHSPHRACGSLRAEVYLGVAEADASCTVEHQAALCAALDAAGVTYRLENYLARHGWAVPDFPVFDAVAAEHHWQRVLGLFGRRLSR
jgi:carboxymethylenebutenolidase